MAETYLDIGSISEGTLRPQDLVPRFIAALRSVSPKDVAEIVDEFPAIFRIAEDSDGLALDYAPDDAMVWDSEDAGWLMEALFETLGDHCPPFTYFGASEGDGACFGVWLSDEAAEDAIDGGEAIRLPAHTDDDSFPSADPDDHDLTEGVEYLFIGRRDWSSVKLYVRRGSNVDGWGWHLLYQY